MDQEPVYKRVLADVQASGWNEPHCDSYTASSPGGIVVDQYNGHSYIYQSSTGGDCIGYHVNGIWIDGVHEVTYKSLRCRSDPTNINNGLVYGYWGATNYLANYNAWAMDNSGLWSIPVGLSAITDGHTQTVLFGEGYVDCDRIGRIALYSWFYHNFGLDWYQQPNTLMFQDHPRAQDCDNWRAQSGHKGGMNVCLFDASVRPVSAGVSQATWSAALLPRDNVPLGSDW
jgi:hypothetical protein